MKNRSISATRASRAINPAKLNEVLACFGGTPEDRMRQVYELMFKDADPQMLQCLAAAEARDGVALERAAHAIKGMAAELGADTLCDVAQKLMKDALDPASCEKAFGAVPRLKQELDRVRDFFEIQSRPKCIPNPLAQAGTEQDTTHRRILIVDDIAMNRKLLRTLLSKAGCKVKDAHNGFEALELLEAEPFDVVFLDVMMPEMSGIEVVRRLRQSSGFNATTRVVGVSASPQDSVRNECMDAGMNAFVAKPIDRNQILAFIA